MNCRLTHRKSVLDEDGHVTKCVSHCGDGYEEDYSWKYGHHCKKLPNGCATRDCRRCVPGFLLVKRKWLRRTSCAKKCPRGFGVDEGKCLELPTGCKDMKCSACINGFFYYSERSSSLSFPLFLFSKCRPRCPTGYQGNRKTNECERKKIKEGCADYFCYRCTKGYYKLMKSYRHQCVKKCPSGLGPVRGNCRKIPKGCETADCSACIDGYFHYKRAIYYHSCRPSCPSGYFEDSTAKKCVACKIEYCNVCDTSADQCEKCNRYKALLVEKTANGTTSDCVSRCPQGYRKIFDYNRMSRVCEKIVKPTEPGKQVIPEGCEDKNCLKCNSGHLKLVTAVGTSCVKQCPSGYFTGKEDCTLCTEPRCDVCANSPFQCNQCKPGYFSVPRMDNNTVRCLSECPPGYSPVARNQTATCEKIPQECKIENCAKCTSPHVQSHHQGCFECKAGFFLKRNIFKDECVPFCPDRFFAGVKPGTNIPACLACGTQFCKTCASRKKCSECYEPFALDFKTGTCKLCKTGRVFNSKTKKCVDIQSKGMKKVTLESLISKK